MHVGIEVRVSVHVVAPDSAASLRTAIWQAPPACRCTEGPPACRCTEDGHPRGTCPVCLEVLEVGQERCRPPCLHAFHARCLQEWLRHRPTCPVCKLSLAAPARELRYRLADLAGLTARELRYIAGYLGITAGSCEERNELELAVVGSPRVRILSCKEELRALAVGRLCALLRTAGVDRSRAMVEKAELVAALFASGRFLEAGPSVHPTPHSPGVEASTTTEQPLARPVRRSRAQDSSRASPY